MTRPRFEPVFELRDPQPGEFDTSCNGCRKPEVHKTLVTGSQRVTESGIEGRHVNVMRLCAECTQRFVVSMGQPLRAALVRWLVEGSRLVRRDRETIRGRGITVGDVLDFLGVEYGEPGWGKCRGCGHDFPDEHEERNGGAWCKRDMQAVIDAGEDPNQLGPCY